jgi:hypothetical protein
MDTAINRFIASEKLSLQTTIPIDRYVKARPEKYETHKLDYTKDKFHSLNTRKPLTDAKIYIRPDLHYDECDQKINNFRSLSDTNANIKIPDNQLKENWVKLKKIIQNRFI